MEDVDNALAIFRKECYFFISSLSFSVLFGTGHWVALGITAQHPPFPLCSLPPQSPNVLGTTLLPEPLHGSY